jgi:hypothetical protein
MPWALIKAGVVVNTILADESHLALIPDQWDSYVEVGLEPGDPAVGWKHNGKKFSKPDPVVVVVDLKEQKKKDIEFASDLLIEFSIFNEERKLSDDEKLLLAKELAPIKTLFYEGDLVAASSLLQKTPVIAKLLTEEIVNDLVEKISAYLSGSDKVEAIGAVKIGEK